MISFSSLSYLSFTFCLIVIHFLWIRVGSPGICVIYGDFCLFSTCPPGSLFLLPQCTCFPHVIDFMSASPVYIIWMIGAGGCTLYSKQVLASTLQWVLAEVLGLWGLVCLFHRIPEWIRLEGTTVVTWSNLSAHRQDSLDHIVQDSVHIVLEYLQWGEEVLELSCPRVNAE